MSSTKLGPPIGLMPKKIWIEQRIVDIEAAIERYKNAFVEIPQEWIDELYEHRQSIK